MNLEHHRKDAKRLVRGVKEGVPQAVARATAVLGDRAEQRFRLSDAQYVIARELGFGTWAELTRTRASTAAGSADPRRTETTVETGLEYGPGDPVRVRVVRRGPRTSVSDDGAALARAGRPGAWRAAAAKLGRQLDVNVSRSGVISLPVVKVGPPEEQVVERIAAAALALYQDLLEPT